MKAVFRPWEPQGAMPGAADGPPDPHRGQPHVIASTRCRQTRVVAEGAQMGAQRFLSSGVARKTGLSEEMLGWRETRVARGLNSRSEFKQGVGLCPESLGAPVWECSKHLGISRHQAPCSPGLPSPGLAA